MKKKKVIKKKQIKTKREKNELYVNFVLDETGSMLSCKDATISGFNEYIKTLEKKAKNILFTLTKFNSSKIETICKAMNIKDVKELNNDTYTPDHTTPLYDAIARTIKDTEKETKKKDVLCVIMTDGEENASVEYNRDKIFKLIKEKEKDNWVFVYLGANQDSWAIGQSIGLSKGNVINYSTKNMTQTMGYAADSTAMYANTSSSSRSAMRGAVLKDRDKAEIDLTF